jgi:hypothetical protein
MAYCGHKKEDIEHTSIIDSPGNKAARPAKPWNPFGELPAPSKGGGGEDDETLHTVSIKKSVPQYNVFERVSVCC